MEMPAYIDICKRKLGWPVLELELDDGQIQSIVEYSALELQRYIHNSKFVTVPFQSCIDVSDLHISDVRFVYPGDVAGTSTSMYNPTNAYGNNTDIAGNPSIYANTPIDPLAWSAFYLGAPGQVSGYTNYVNNYYAYTQTLKGINTGDVTKLTFNYNKKDEKLYINNNVRCKTVTIEYIPRFDNVEEINNDAWIDILVRYSVANLKITLGRIRSRFTQSNALWAQDGEALLEEGNTELNELRTYLDASASLLRPR